MEEAFPAIWFHGSPADLAELRVGSAITPDRALAKAFSHKPTLVSSDERGQVRHDGRIAGYLYRVAERVRADDVMHIAGAEWHIRRPLRVTRIAPTAVTADELLSLEEMAALLRHLAALQEQKPAPREA